MKVRGALERGLFDARTPYARWGRGSRRPVVLPGRPGAADPTSPAFRFMAGWVSPLSPDFPRAPFAQTAARIPGAVLRLYGGRGHAGTLADRRLASDVREFLG